MVLHQCYECGHRWRPKDPRPGDAVYCPNCGAFHSRRAGFLKPPEPVLYHEPRPPDKPARDPRPVKPYDGPRAYYTTGLDCPGKARGIERDKRAKGKK